MAVPITEVGQVRGGWGCGLRTQLNGHTDETREARWARAGAPPLPGYGIRPYVTISISRIPKDQTSDLMVKEPKLMASGAVHLMGNLAPMGLDRTESGRAQGAVMAEEQDRAQLPTAVPCTTAISLRSGFYGSQEHACWGGWLRWGGVGRGVWGVARELTLQGHFID